MMSALQKNVQASIHEYHMTVHINIKYLFCRKTPKHLAKGTAEQHLSRKPSPSTSSPLDHNTPSKLASGIAQSDLVLTFDRCDRCDRDSLWTVTTYLVTVTAAVTVVVTALVTTTKCCHYSL